MYTIVCKGFYFTQISVESTPHEGGFAITWSRWEELHDPTILSAKTKNLDPKEFTLGCESKSMNKWRSANVAPLLYQILSTSAQENIPPNLTYQISSHDPILSPKIKTIKWCFGTRVWKPEFYCKPPIISIKSEWDDSAPCSQTPSSQNNDQSLRYLMEGSRVVSYVNMLNPYNQLQLETPSVRFVCIGSDPPSSRHPITTPFLTLSTHEWCKLQITTPSKP